MVGGFGKGVLKFVGLHDADGRERLGIELEQPVGKNNGTVRKHTYFTCPQQHGLLCGPEKVVRFSELMKDNFSRRSTVSTATRPQTASAASLAASGGRTPTAVTPETRRSAAPPNAGSQAQPSAAQAAIHQTLREMFPGLSPADLSAIAKSAGSADHAVQLALAIGSDDAAPQPGPSRSPAGTQGRARHPAPSQGAGGRADGVPAPPLPVKRYSAEVAESVLSAGGGAGGDSPTRSPRVQPSTSASESKVRTSRQREDAGGTRDAAPSEMPVVPPSRRRGRSLPAVPVDAATERGAPAESSTSPAQDDAHEAETEIETDAAAEARRSRPAWRRAVRKVSKVPGKLMGRKSIKGRPATDGGPDGEPFDSNPDTSERNPYNEHPSELFISPDFVVDDGERTPSNSNPFGDSVADTLPRRKSSVEASPKFRAGSSVSGVSGSSSIDVDNFMDFAAEYSENEDEVDC